MSSVSGIRTRKPKLSGHSPLGIFLMSPSSPPYSGRQSRLNRSGPVGGDLTRGVFQYIKYEAVMAAELVGKGRRREDFEVKAILAVEGKLESGMLGLVHTLGVDVREIPVGIYRT